MGKSVFARTIFCLQTADYIMKYLNRIHVTATAIYFRMLLQQLHNMIKTHKANIEDFVCFDISFDKIVKCT